MSDVDTVPSLPAALDHRPNALAVKVNHQSTSGPLSPKRTAIPPISRREVGPTKEVDSAVGDGDGPPSPKADSEAETIIQSGRESLSPEKRRKYIKHEPKRRDDDGNDQVDAESELPPNDVEVRKSKLKDDDSSDRSDRDARPSSPRWRTGSPSIVKIEKPDESQSVSSKIELSSVAPTRTSRKRSFSESVSGEPEVQRSVRRNRSPSHRDRDERGLSNGVSFPRPKSNDRSVSPVRQAHRRTTSGGDSYRKRKAPTPLITGFQRQSSEDRQSVSSTSGSPLPSAHLRKVASVDGTSASPARPTGHKKQRDQNGRTRLARACAAQELEAVIARHAERPEDLNVADNAGNTPLQIASLEGSVPIVKFLISAGCDVETCNIDKDSPLIDAAENGHLEVVKVLLEAGANPRAINSHGDEPTDLVPDDCEEIRRVLEEAKANPRPSRRSEEHTGPGNRDSSSRRVSGASPRESPPVNGQRSPPLFSATTKRKSVRSEATRNDLLWTKATPENLQAFAAKGDIAGVANILNVGQKADTESMIAAAKGGHDEVLSLLLGLGYADPDPEPVHGSYQKPGYNTPMLAAIGRGNTAVIKLLLDQPGFNPARRLYKDRTYYELSRDRRADNWEEEYDLLRDAHDKYIKTKKQRKSDFSSPRRAREREKENKRSGRKDSVSPAPRSKKAIGSPGPRDNATKELAPSKDKRRDGFGHQKEKSISGAPRQKPSHGGVSDPDGSRPEQSRTKFGSTREAESTRNEEVHKRRRLIAGRPPDRKAPSLPSSDSLSGREESTKPRPDRFTEPAPKSAPPHLKRGRSTASPERPRSRGSEADRQGRNIHKKKRRVLSEDGAPNLTNGGVKRSQPSRMDDGKSPSRQKDDSHPPGARKEAAKGLDTPPSRAADRKPVKEEQGKSEAPELNDIPMEDSTKEEETNGEEHVPQEMTGRRRLSEQMQTNAETNRIDGTDPPGVEAESNHQNNTQMQDQLAEEARLMAEAEKVRALKEEEERVARAARIAQEKAEEERKRKEAEQRRIKQAEDERQKRLEQERQRLAKLRREQEEQEQRRRDALPSRLRIAANLVGSNDPEARSHVWLRKFMPVVTAETKQLDPACNLDIANEKWVPNYLVAPLLATNDLQLSQYASWEKRNATATQRMNLWRVTRRMLVQADDTEFMASSFGQVMQKDSEARPKYFDMEHVFWVKLSDFMDLVPHIPHLHGLDIRFLKMHIDQEPIVPAAFELPQTNGHVLGATHIENGSGFYPGTGLTNGYGHSRPSTYV